MYTVGAMKRSLSPMLLAKLAIGGACLAAASYFVSFLDIPRFPVGAVGFWAEMWASRLQLGLLLIAVAPGILVWWWAERRFKRELLDGRWPEASLAGVRGLVKRQLWWIWSCYALGVVASFLAYFAPGADKRTINPFAIYLFSLPPEAVRRLHRLVIPPPPPRPSGGLVELRDVQPLRSEHWGEPPLMWTKQGEQPRGEFGASS